MPKATRQSPELHDKKMSDEKIHEEALDIASRTTDTQMGLEAAKQKKTRWGIERFIKDKDLPNPWKMAFLAGLNRAPQRQGSRLSVKHVYAGTVDPVTKAKRRKKNKAARHARAMHRRRNK
jgi:hypothetical protein